MTIPKHVIMAGAILIVASIAIVALREGFSPSGATETPSTTPLTSEGPDEVLFDGIPNQRLVQPAPPRSSITGPGSCALSGGKIVFVTPNTARHENATLTYENIDDPARLIYWKITPNDGGIRVGPNIFASLKLPKGSTILTVTPEQNHASKYTLTASVSYGVWRDNAVIGTTAAECKGKLTVEFN